MHIHSFLSTLNIRLNLTYQRIIGWRDYENETDIRLHKEETIDCIKDGYIRYYS